MVEQCNSTSQTQGTAGNREVGNFVNRAVGLISRGGGYLACDLSHDADVTYPSCGQNDWRTDACENITSFAGGKNKDESINIKGRR